LPQYLGPQSYSSGRGAWNAKAILYFSWWLFGIVASSSGVIFLHVPSFMQMRICGRYLNAANNALMRTTDAAVGESVTSGALVGLLIGGRIA
jgi:hypothetical protein